MLRNYVLLVLGLLSPFVMLAELAHAQAIAQSPASEGRLTRARRSYFGIGGGVGVSGGETGLGEGGFSTVGRIGLSDNLSIHTASIIGDQSTITAAVTGGFALRNPSGRVVVYPFLGGGVSADTSNDFEIDPLLTAGVDVPLAERLTATGRISVGFGEDETDVGIILGAGFTF